MNMTDDELDMAQSFYGYGCWKAPYWFIGPEQAMGRDKEKKPDEKEKTRRVKAWCDLSKLDLGNYGLVDCRKFHCQIGVDNWHRQKPKPALQPTWRKLLLTLMAFPGGPVDLEDRRRYQREEWGRMDGKTCVIELSGLPAPSLKDPNDRESFRAKRVKFIHSKLRNPIFVIMYGKRCREAFEEFTHGTKPIPQAPVTFAEIRRCGSTFFALTPSPTDPRRGQRNDDWIELGRKLRELA